MKRDSSFSAGLVAVATLSFLIRIMGFPYDAAAIRTVRDFIACLLSAAFFTGAVVLFAGIRRNLQPAQIGRALALSMAWTAVCIAARYAALAAWGANAIAVSYVLEMLMIAGCLWCCRRAAGTAHPSAHVTIRRFAWLLAALLIVIAGVITAIQLVIIARCTAVYTAGSASYQYSYQHLQWIITGGGFLLAVLTTLAYASILAPSHHAAARKGSSLALLIVLILVGAGFLFVKGVVLPEGSIVRLFTSSTVDNRSYDSLSVSTSRRETERLGNMPSEALRLMHLYDAEGCLLGSTLVTDSAEYITLSVGDTPVGMAHPYFLMFSDGGQQKVYALDKLAQAEPHEVLLAFARDRITVLDFRLFTQCAAYLCRHDAGFIRPILMQYAEDDYSAGMHLAMGDIKPTYIRAVSRRLLERINE